MNIGIDWKLFTLILIALVFWYAIQERRDAK